MQTIVETDNHFWLYRWIDACGVKSFEDARTRLSDAVNREALFDFASAVEYTTEPLPRASIPSITAGCGIDLSGNLDCFAWECARDRVNDLLKHVCLYFDRVVVVAAGAHDTLEERRFMEAEQFEERILSHIRVLLFLRDIGATDLLVFRQKPPACQRHLKEHANHMQLGQLTDNLGAEISFLEEQAVIQIDPHEDHLHFRFDHPMFEHTVWGSVPRPPEGKGSVERARRIVLAEVIERYFAHLISDVKTARTLGTPLGSTVRYHRRLLEGRQEAPGIPDVAFSLGLPILDGADPATVLRLRLEERDAFDRFREALRKAIAELCRSAVSSDPESMAAEIQHDLIAPTLQNIEGRLTSAVGALKRKAALNLSLGALATICGIYSKQPLLAAGGLQSAIGTLTAMHKRFDDKREIQLSDLYFLWKVHDAHSR